MTEHIRRELRLFILILVMLISYAAVVLKVAVTYGQLELVLNYGSGEIVKDVWIVALAFAFIAYMIDVMLRKRPQRPLQFMLHEIWVKLLRADWLLAWAGIFCGFISIFVLFQPLKVMIGNVRGFPLDHLLLHLDKMLFLGMDPWRVTHALIGDYGTYALQVAYGLWFVMLWFSIVYLMLRPELVELRARYLVAFLMCWIVVGSAGAWLFASAGPCFFERAFGDPYFAPLMNELHATDARLQQIGFGLDSLGIQDMLWNAYADKQRIFGGGISAMPSVHVSIATVMALGGRFINRKAGYALGLFAFVIWIGSIHLGWHYAVDGIVAAVMTLGIWWFSGWLVERFVFRGAPAASLRPALAE